MSDYIRYGDTICLLNGHDNWSGLFLSILPKTSEKGGVGEAHVLYTELASSTENHPCDYRWTIIPAQGSSKKNGDVVAFDDRVTFVAHDSAGNERFLCATAKNATAKDGKIGPVMAEKGPLSSSASSDAIWLIQGVSSLNGWQGSGKNVPQFEYGKANYLELINEGNAGRLCWMQWSDEPLFKDLVLTVPFESAADTEAAGLANWWTPWRNTEDYKDGGDNNGNGHPHDGGNGGDCHNMQVGTVGLDSSSAPSTKGGDMDGFTQVNFPKPFPDGSKVVVVPMTQTFNGPDTPGLRIAHVTTTGFKIRINELVSHGGHKPLSDGKHVKETIGWVAFTVDK